MLVFDDVEKKITIVPEFVKYEHEINPHNPVAIKNNSYVR